MNTVHIVLINWYTKGNGIGAEAIPYDNYDNAITDMQREYYKYISKVDNNTISVSHQGSYIHILHDNGDEIEFEVIEKEVEEECEYDRLAKEPTEEEVYDTMFTGKEV